MKKILLMLLLTCSVSMFAQTEKSGYVKRDNGSLSLSNVDTVRNVSAKEFYKRALKWVSATYKNPKEVIQTQDENAGLLVIKGIAGANDLNYMHKLTFEFKENRYRWVISEIIFEPDAIVREYIKEKPIEDMPRYKGDKYVILNDDFSEYIKSFQTALKASDNW